MLVVLRENVDKLGRIGDLVNVSDGFARNFLLPRNLVVIADEKNKAAVEHHKRLLERKRQSQKLAAQEIAQKLTEFSCTIVRKVGEHDKLYGSVTAHDILDTLTKAGFNLDKKAIHIDAPIKALGVHSVVIMLEPEITATLKVWVVKEE